MKATKILLTAAMFAASTCAFAQFANTSKSNSSFLGSSASVSEDSYRRFEVGYTIGTMKSDGYSAEDSENGVTVGIISGHHLPLSLPLFYEIGLKATWLTSSNDYEGDDLKFHYLNAAVPVNLVYKIAIADDITINPYAGLNFKANILAMDKYDGETLSYFDKDDMEDEYLDEDLTWNRFQLGANIGVGINVKSFYLSYNFQPDFMELAEQLKYPTHTFSIGVNF